MANIVPVRRKSFETKLFEKFDDDQLLEAAELIMKGELRNIPQLNFVQDIIKRKLEKEKQEGHVNIDYMSLIDVGREALNDDGFVDTLAKAVEKKRRKMVGEEIHTRKNYDQMRETVDTVAEFRGMSKKDVKDQTRHFLSGRFDKELESHEATEQEEFEDIDEDVDDDYSDT